jgi:hypothetical protein
LAEGDDRGRLIPGDEPLRPRSQGKIAVCADARLGSRRVTWTRAGPDAPTFAPSPGAAEIPRLVAQAREAGMRVAHTVEGAALSVSGGLSVAVYRIVQEALTNVRKHAGPGAAAEVRLRYGTDQLLVRVADDGHGWRPVLRARDMAWPGCGSGPRCTAARCGRDLARAAASR